MREFIRVSAPVLIASLLFAPLSRAEDEAPASTDAVAEPALPTAEPAPIEASREDETPPARKWKRNDTGMMVGGIVCTGIGGLGLLIGGVTLALSGASGTSVCSNGSCHPATEGDRQDMRTVGWVSLAAGAVLTGVGIPLIISGAKRKPIEQALRDAPVHLLVGPSGGGVRIAF